MRGVFFKISYNDTNISKENLFLNFIILHICYLSKILNTLLNYCQNEIYLLDTYITYYLIFSNKKRLIIFNTYFKVYSTRILDVIDIARIEGVSIPLRFLNILKKPGPCLNRGQFPRVTAEKS